MMFSLLNQTIKYLPRYTIRYEVYMEIYIQDTKTLASTKELIIYFGELKENCNN